MARVNKFASVNLNDLFGKKEPAVKTVVNGAGSVTRPKGASHGGMLVLTRPVKKQPVKIGAAITSNLNKENTELLATPTENISTELSKAPQLELKNEGTENSNPEPVQHLNNPSVYVLPSLGGSQTVSAPGNVEVVTSEKTVLHGEEFPTLQASLAQANTNGQYQRPKDSQQKQIDIPRDELEKLQQLSLQAHKKNISDGSTDLDIGRFQPNRPQFFGPPHLRGEQRPVEGRPETTIERSLVRDNDTSDWIDDERTNGIGPRPGSANSYRRMGSANSDRRSDIVGYGDHIQSRPSELAQSDYGVNAKDEQFEMRRLHDNRSTSRPPSRGGSMYEREALPWLGSDGSRYEKEAVYQPGSGRSRYERESFSRPGSGGGEYVREAFARPGSGGRRYDREMITRPGSGGGEYEREAFARPGSGGRRYDREMITRPGSGGRRNQMDSDQRRSLRGGRNDVEMINNSGNAGENYEREVTYSPLSGDGMYEREVISRPASGGGRYYEREAMGRPGSGGAYYPQQGFRGSNNGRPGSGGSSHETEVFGRPQSGGGGGYRINQECFGYSDTCYRGQHAFHGYEANREKGGFKDNSFRPKGTSRDRDEYWYGRNGAQDSTRIRENFRQVAGYGGSVRGFRDDNGQRYDDSNLVRSNASGTAYGGYDRYAQGSRAGGKQVENDYQNKGMNGIDMNAMENSNTFVNSIVTGKSPTGIMHTSNEEQIPLYLLE